MPAPLGFVQQSLGVFSYLCRAWSGCWGTPGCSHFRCPAAMGRPGDDKALTFQDDTLPVNDASQSSRPMSTSPADRWCLRISAMRPEPDKRFLLPVLCNAGDSGREYSLISVLYCFLKRQAFDRPICRPGLSTHKQAGMVRAHPQ